MPADRRARRNASRWPGDVDEWSPRWTTNQTAAAAAGDDDDDNDRAYIPPMSIGDDNQTGMLQARRATHAASNDADDP